MISSSLFYFSNNSTFSLCKLYKPTKNDENLKEKYHIDSKNNKKF